MGGRVVDYKKLKKQDLVQLLEMYSNQMTVLDIMLNDMTDVNISDIQKWLDSIQDYLEKFAHKQINKNNNYDEDHYKQVTIQEALELLEDDR
jgi:hypothetical protein